MLINFFKKRGRERIEKPIKSDIRVVITDWEGLLSDGEREAMDEIIRRAITDDKEEVAIRRAIKHKIKKLRHKNFSYAFLGNDVDVII